MKKRNKRYSELYKKDAVRLLEARGTKTAPEIAEELGVGQSMLYRWREEFGTKSKGTSELAESSRAEMEAMRRPPGAGCLRRRYWKWNVGYGC